METLSLQATLSVRALNAGLFVSQGRGAHPERVIDSYELIFVQAGALGMWEEGQRFDLRAGQSLLLWPGRRHGGTATYPPDLRFYWVHFDIATAGAVDESEPLRIPQVATVAHPDRLTELFRWFLDAQEGGRLQPVPASLLVMLLLCEVAGGGQGAAPAREPESGLAHRAEVYIRLHSDQSVTTKDIARSLNCHPDYLGRVYRAAYGLTLTEAIHRRRLRRAQNLLLDSDYSVEAVARACGFEDPGYFRRLFRRYLGMSPGAYRRLYARVHVNTE